MVDDTAGTAPSSRRRQVLTQGGRLLIVNATLPEMLRAPELKLLENALAQFEDFCVVTQRLGAAFPVDVRVLDCHGTVLKP